MVPPVPQVVGGRVTESGRLGAFITKVKKGSLADVVGHLRAGGLLDTHTHTHAHAHTCTRTPYTKSCTHTCIHTLTHTKSKVTMDYIIIIYIYIHV